jgi:hypothetical protein
MRLKDDGIRGCDRSISASWRKTRTDAERVTAVFVQALLDQYFELQAKAAGTHREIAYRATVYVNLSK